ncbi:5'-3' exonuclease [Actinokineospora cianjurensis]|uniref:5'-3' exonuclease n=1 Tax=Actinokineospora cianjurensis TaxID=585224 RepID=A0A421B486_9PSEU|nr:5'-3' exonuclease H3TH domain-containing protein [Actinokineospora cianjurensis]RLK59098.1 5'-3' exonuclease [Actinokineospora cianjurensis]
MSGPLVLLDSASLYFRSFFALPESMTSPDGVPVNAVRGFAGMIAQIVTERHPARLVACLDADWRPAFRVEAIPSYKAQRVADPSVNAEEVPDTLTPQVPIIIDLLDALGIATAQAAGYEADDVIGTLAHREAAAPVEIITGDRDLFQCVRDEPTPVRVVYVGRGWSKAEEVGPQELAARYGLPAEGLAYADMAVLRGDPSDGLPGITGIGEKTAAKLITKFGSLAALVDAAAAGSKDVPLKVREAFTHDADYLAKAPLVVRVATDVTIEATGTPELPHAVDVDRVRELQERWALGSAVDRLLKALGV